MIVRRHLRRLLQIHKTRGLYLCPKFEIPILFTNFSLISPISGIPSTIQTLGTNSVAIGSGTNPVAIDNKIEQAMVSLLSASFFHVFALYLNLRGTVSDRSERNRAHSNSIGHP